MPIVAKKTIVAHFSFCFEEIDAFYQILVHFATRFHRRRFFFFLEINQSCGGNVC